ncbi:MAG: hydrogenase maturation protease [Campylobacteraceae bacterium]|nr:hydrogenase maturation protease [Campylobacteraceae bacterium]
MKVLVLGIGNVLYSDEGIGVHFVKQLEKNYKFHSNSHSITFIDGGALAHFLMHIIDEYDYLILVDCIDADDGEVGDVYFFDYLDMPKMIKWSGSAHEVEMLQTLQMMELSGDMPTTKILGVIPKRIEPITFELSEEVIKATKVMEKVVLNHLKKLGFEYEKVANFDAQDIANEFEKVGKV